jgi:hypothetical protein
MSNLEDARESSPEECVLCGRVLAGVGLLISVVFLYISIDVLSDGRLSSIFSKGVSDG